MLKPQTRRHRSSSTRCALLTTDSTEDRAPIRGAAFRKTDPKKRHGTGISLVTRETMANARYPRPCPGDTLRWHGWITTMSGLTVVAGNPMRSPAAAECNKEAGTQSRRDSDAAAAHCCLVGKKSFLFLLLLFRSECPICTETIIEFQAPRAPAERRAVCEPNPLRTPRPGYYPCCCISTSDLRVGDPYHTPKYLRRSNSRWNESG